MRRLGEATLLLFLLGTLHSVRANFDDYGFEEEEHDYRDDDSGENEKPEYDYEEEDADDDASTTGTGSPPQNGPKLVKVDSICNNQGCEIELTWDAPPGVCFVGYRVGFKQSLGGSNWTWIDSIGGTHVDVRSGKQFILEEAQDSFHVHTIPNLPYETTYQVVVEAFNPFGSKMGNIMESTTPPGR